MHRNLHKLIGTNCCQLSISIGTSYLAKKNKPIGNHERSLHIQGSEGTFQYALVMTQCSHCSN